MRTLVEGVGKIEKKGGRPHGITAQKTPKTALSGQTAKNTGHQRA